MSISQRIIVFFVLLCWAPSLFAQLPKDFNDIIFANGYTFPTSIEFDKNGQLYIATKPGRIYVIDSSGAKVDEPLVDISEEVTDWSDHGLIDFALDPDFTNNGYLYLYYAVDPHYLNYYGTDQYDPRAMVINAPTIGRVTRFQADPATQFTTLIPDSRKVLLGESIGNGIPLLYEFHGLGSLLAANDGTLLLSCGDATTNTGPSITGGDTIGSLTFQAIEQGIISEDMDIGSYRAQYKGIYSGKVMRIDAETGDGLPSNPFYEADQPRSPQSRIWAMGFRNPYRIALKPESGSHYAADGNPGIIFVGDVGNGSWEELNIITKGGQNFGWPIAEGIETNWQFWTQEVPQNQKALNPIAQTEGCEVPFFNFRDLLIRARDRQPNLPVNPCNSASIIPEEYLIEEQLPVIAWSNARWNKPARAITPTYDPNTGYAKPLETTEAGSPVNSEAFAGFSSLAGVFYTGGNYPESYQNTYFAVDFSGWIKSFTFDENLQLEKIEPFHNGAKDIIHLIAHPKTGDLFYINLDGEIRSITYGGNPPPNAVIDADTFFGPGPLSVKFDASQSTDSNLPITKYFWDFGDGTSSEEIQPSHTFTSDSAEPESFAVRLTVTDSLGASATTEAVVSLNNTPPAVEITSFKDGDQYSIKSTSLLLLDAEVIDQEHAPEELQYEWRIFLHHNDHYHPEPAIYDPTSFTLVSPLGCIDEIYWYRIELTVTDPEGLKTHVKQSIYPYCGDAFWQSTELKAAVNEKQVDLDWQSSLEEGLDTIIIQRGTDIYHFSNIGKVAARGNNTEYAFIDENPLMGTNFYRLKLRNTEGAFVYSNLATVTYPKPLDLTVQPTLARQFFDIKVKHVQENAVAFVLYDSAGRKVLQNQWPVDNGTTFEKRLYTNQLSNGVYFYQMQSGDQEASGKIVVSK